MADAAAAAVALAVNVIAEQRVLVDVYHDHAGRHHVVVALAAQQQQRVVHERVVVEHLSLLLHVLLGSEAAVLLVATRTNRANKQFGL